ncbi:MAG: zf-HC2 domain-containing protein [Anaerolineales bacterium]|jgi:anti-sigma factor RsiW
MPHLPFEDWLFPEEALSKEQQQALQDHLSECPGCRQLARLGDESQAALREMGVARPPRDFVERWSQMRQRREARQKLWSAWVILALCGAGALILSAILALQLAALALSPIHWVVELFLLTTSLASQLRVAEVLWSVMLQGARELVPLPIWAGLAVSLGFLCALWVFVLLRMDVQGVRK